MTELQKAAAWVRLFRERGVSDDFQEMMTMGNSCAVLAEAWLAEHPADDDKPVTLEWLTSVGFDELDINGQSILLPAMDGCDVVELFIDNEDEDGHWWAALIQSDENDHVLITSRYYDTRGDVRRLCRALGIELKDSKGNPQKTEG